MRISCLPPSKESVMSLTPAKLRSRSSMRSATARIRSKSRPAIWTSIGLPPRPNSAR